MDNGYITAEVKGLDTLQQKLEELPVKLAKRGLKAAARAGATVFVNGMVRLAPRHTGFLAEHFNIRIKFQKNELACTAYIGPQGKMDYPEFLSGAYRIARNAKGKVKKIGRIAVATVARFLEFGTSKMSKKPFMTQAFETGKEAALEAVIVELKDELGL